MPFCRKCNIELTSKAKFCPICGVPEPTNPHFSGYGYEYKSKVNIFGWPLVHISFKYSEKKIPVPAVGIIAIGQFTSGFICIGQFSLGLFTLSQFSIAAWSISQFGIAVSIIAQIGFYLKYGYGQLVYDLKELLF